MPPRGLNTGAVHYIVEQVGSAPVPVATMDPLFYDSFSDDCTLFQAFVAPVSSGPVSPYPNSRYGHNSSLSILIPSIIHGGRADWHILGPNGRRTRHVYMQHKGTIGKDGGGGVIETSFE